MSTPSSTAIPQETLSERYLVAALHTIHGDQRTELEPEIRSLVGDAVQAKLEAGLGHQEAERAALSELGDPERLAAAYADRPLHLIGPGLYLDWWRLLKRLWLTVLPPVAAVAAVAILLTNPRAIGVVAAITLTVGVHIAFWTTLTFAIIERSGHARAGMTRPWTPDLLPASPSSQRRRPIDLVATLVLLVLVAGALVWQQVASPVRGADGSSIPFLRPDLWALWLPYLLALLALEAALAVAVHLKGRWTWTAAAVQVMLQLAFAVPAVLLLQAGRLVNPEFLQRAAWPHSAEAGNLATKISVAVVVLTMIWNVVNSALKAAGRRGGRPAER